LMSFTGTGLVTASDGTALILAGSDIQRATATAVVSGLPRGAGETFTALYRNQGTGSINCTYKNRSMYAIPLP
jgi:hypothetical protein